MTHCCARMASAVTFGCDQHDDQFECPDALVHFNERFDEYGLIVHDGGRSYVIIAFCPWCGAQLPESTRERFEASPTGPTGPTGPAGPTGPSDELEPPPQIVTGPPPPPEPPVTPVSRDSFSDGSTGEKESRLNGPVAPGEPALEAALAGLRKGDFSNLEPHFQPPSEGSFAPDVVRWHADGRFQHAPDALAEALTCAAFLGYVDVVRYFVKQGVNPSGGAATGLNALHWAANRGQLDVVDALLKARAPWKAKSSHGGNVLDTAVWSAIHEPRPVHQEMVILLLKAGATPENQTLPTGHAGIDGLFRQFGYIR